MYVYISRGGKIEFQFKLFGFRYRLQSIHVGKFNPTRLETQTQAKLNQIELGMNSSFESYCIENPGLYFDLGYNSGYNLKFQIHF